MQIRGNYNVSVESGALSFAAALVKCYITTTRKRSTISDDLVDPPPTFKVLLHSSMSEATRLMAGIPIDPGLAKVFSCGTWYMYQGTPFTFPLGAPGELIWAQGKPAPTYEKFIECWTCDQGTFSGRFSYV